jgi:hypothetical protein
VANLYENAKVFYICTNGGNASYKSIEEIAKEKNAVAFFKRLVS